MLYLSIKKYIFLVLTWATWHLRNALLLRHELRPNFQVKFNFKFNEQLEVHAQLR